MKLRKSATFAHPVVAPFLDDVIDNRFGLRSFSARADGSHYCLDAEFELQNMDLADYIAKGVAAFALLTEARNFFYRALHSPLKSADSVKLDADSLSGDVECIPLVVATRDIPDYRLSDFNTDYKNVRIAVRSGDVLAIGDGQTFPAEKEYDTLQKLSSIMQVLEDKKIRPGSMDVALGEDKISIFLCPDDHARYSTLSKLAEAAPVLMQMLAIPALQEAIADLRRSEEAGGQRRWETALRKRLEKMNISLTDSTPADIACRLLDGSMTPSLATLDGLIAGGAGE